MYQRTFLLSTGTIVADDIAREALYKVRLAPSYLPPSELSSNHQPHPIVKFAFVPRKHVQETGYHHCRTEPDRTFKLK